ncbi:MAG TPA: hypothetical protein VME68_13965 [Acidobacteriaceae bacterium]|nr:hypothetical protein [Acidobacteriaceae bacterium]
MAKATLLFAAMLIALGWGGYVGSGRQHPTALIPLWFGLALAVFGALAISRSEARRKLFMHINVTIGLLGFLGAAVEAVIGAMKATPASQAAEGAYLISAETSKTLMAGLLLIYVLLCVRSFILARRARVAV